MKSGNQDDLEEGTTWQMNPFLIKGQDGITKTFNKNLSESWHQLLQIRCRIIPKYSYAYWLKYQIVNPNLINGIRGLLSLVTKALNLSFGLRKVQVYSKDQIIQEIIKERNIQTVNANWKDLKNAFFAFAEETLTGRYENDVKKRKAIEILSTDFERLLNDFNSTSSKYESDELKKLEKSGVDEDTALLEIFNEKQRMLFEMIRSGKHIKLSEVQEHLICLIKATQIYQRHYTKLSTAIREVTDQTHESIQKRHPVKSLVSIWKDGLVEAELPPQVKKLTIECNQNIVANLTAAGLKSELLLFKRFIDFQDSADQIYKDNYKRIQKANTQPCRVFETVQHLFPPYKIEMKLDGKNKPQYEEIKTKSYFTHTDFFGWRVVLQFIRWKVWSVNVFLLLIQNLTRGTLGLQFFFRTKPFVGSYYLERDTGKRIPSQTHDPLWVMLCNVKTGIEKSRALFESKPDRGIFGKNNARIVNYLECYFIRLILGGFITVCIILPLLAILNCLLSILFAVTSFLWIPVTLTFRSIYHFAIWDFDSPTRKGWSYYPTEYIMYQTYERFPFVFLVIQITTAVFQILLSLLSAFVIHPALSILSIVRAFTRRLVSEATDLVMCRITQRIGRQPEMDTIIAWKTKGKGVARQYSYAIDTDDVKFLLRGQLERIELEEFESRINRRLNEPQDVFNALSSGLFKKFGISSSNNSYLNVNISDLRNALNKQLVERRKVLPKAPSCNIKFSEEELSIIFGQCEKIVQQYIQSRNMGWIFARYSIDDQADFKLLTEQLIVQIFNDENVLYAMSEQDKRVEVKKSKQAKYQSIKRAIEGEGELIVLSHTITQRFKKFRKTSLFPFVDASTIKNNVLQVNAGEIRFEQQGGQFNNYCFVFPSSAYIDATQKASDASKKTN